MKHAKGSNTEAVVKREKARAYAKHWTAGRSHGEHGLSFKVPMSRKSVKRIRRSEKLAATYQAFFADPVMRAEITRQELDWCVSLHPRLVRDTVLGSLR